MTLSAPVPIKLYAWDQEHRNVAFKFLDAFAGLHDSIVSLDQILLEVCNLVEVHDAVPLALREQKASFGGEFLKNRHDIRLALERVKSRDVPCIVVARNVVDFLPRFLDDVIALFHATHLQDHLDDGAAAENQQH